jgi:hypothetical protein
VFSPGGWNTCCTQQRHHCVNAPSYHPQKESNTQIVLKETLCMANNVVVGLVKSSRRAQCSAASQQPPQQCTRCLRTKLDLNCNFETGVYENRIPCSRDPAVWKEMDVLIDVGGEYDPSTCRYDHHQRGFEEVLGHGFATKLSSAGLVYKHYGMEIIAGASPQRPLNFPPHPCCFQQCS